MKIDCKRQACYLIARAMHEEAPILPADTLITSVPTATARIRERGFDHGRLIAQEFARLRGLSYKQLLIRHGRAKQAGASRAQRTAQIKDKYQVRHEAAVRDRLVLVIDDVITTGTTIAEVAHVLKPAGARRVDGLVFGQTPKSQVAPLGNEEYLQPSRRH
jgi:predicted amidophosphoribosyltransferase